MIDTLVLHPHSKKQVAQYMAAPAQAALIVGPTGIGKTHLARVIAASILQISLDELYHYPYFLFITPDGNSISIDAIRELQRFLLLKTLGRAQQLRRVVIVEQADTLTVEAQNAFLKLLEEPPVDTLILLTAAHRRALLPTILSRVQTITLHVPHEHDVKAYFSAYGSAAQIDQMYLLSGGLPGLMHGLLDKDANHPLRQGVSQAKDILQKTLFERLVLVESLSKQKDEANAVITALLRIARTGIAQATANNNQAKLKQWHHVLKTAWHAQTALHHNTNTKLVLTHMVLQL